jgi:dTMP kinase
MYIALEGVDYTGKSTLIKSLKKEHKNYSFTQEPYNKKLVNKMLKQANDKSITLTYLYDRANHYENIIKHHKLNTIISDRSFISGIAYDWFYRDFKFMDLVLLNEFIVKDIKPDFIILVWFNYNDKAIFERRREKRGVKDIYDKQPFEQLLRLQSYIIYVLDYYKIPYKKINASLSKKELVKEVNSILNKLKENK